MTYLVQSAISVNFAMRNRVAQCATEQDIADADVWAEEHRREWAGAPGWSAAWESALAGHPDDEEYDPGMDEAVITDQMILSQVQAMIP